MNMTLFEDNNIIKLQTVDSTNSYAMGMIKQLSPNKSFVVISEIQTNGRGMGDNEWLSDTDKNLTFTMALKMDFLSPDNIFMINKAVSLAVVEAVSVFINSVDLKIKWPNDIYWKNKKMGGILIENIINGEEINFAIVGVGLNVNQENFSGSLPNPISIKNILKKTISKELVFETILEKTEIYYNKLKDKKYEDLTKSFVSLLYRFEKFEKYLVGGTEKELKIVGVDHFGEIIMEDNNKVISKFDFKEIIFL